MNLDVLWQKIEESEKAGSCQELNPGHLACVASALLLHELLQPPTLTILYM